MEDNIEKSITFSINSRPFKVSKDVDNRTLLVDFIRRTACLPGTKWMCREGGCGACVVTQIVTDPITGKKKPRAINSCLVPLLSCDGTEITTIEGLGNARDGYHPIQTQLAEGNGSQCGFCSPGMVMSVHGFVKSKAGRDISMQDVENILDGNICRCTGYRPIMDAMKGFAKDAPVEMRAACLDLEDLGATLAERKCPKSGQACGGICNGTTVAKDTGDQGNGNRNPTLTHSNGTSNGDCPEKDENMFQMGDWYRPSTLQQLTGLLATFDKGIKYRLVAGNTGTGVYKEDGPYDAFVDLSCVAELHSYSVTTPVTVGGAVTLSALQELLASIADKNSDYWYGPILAEHIGKIGSSPLRNAASIAGNLMLKHGHPEFPSDAFIVLATVGAQLDVIDRAGAIEQVNLEQFLETDMRGRVVMALRLPALSTDHVIRTFKIMPRFSNAHAYINAGFCARIDRMDANRIVGKPTVLFGGINAHFARASETERFLEGKSASDQKILQKALKVLDTELVPDEDDLLAPNANYRKTVAEGLLYKFLLTIVGDEADEELRSGSLNLERGLTTGKQDFDTDPKVWPIHQPVIKLEAQAQCAGEAQYVDDIPVRSGELHGAFVYSTQANCQIGTIDASAALDSPGVVAFFDGKTNKFKNRFSRGDTFDSIEVEEVFCSGNVLHAGQVLGMIVAETQAAARRAVPLVRVTYRDIKKPVLTIRDAMKDPDRIMLQTYFGPPDVYDSGDLEEAWKNSTQIVEGEFEIGSQYHFYMETHVTLSVPTNDGIDVFCSTQDGDEVQTAIADCLDLKKSQVHVQISRVGGGYGGKVTRATQIAVASAMAASHLRCPVRLQLDINTNMAVNGGRLPYYCKYQVGVDAEGRLQAVEVDVMSDCGSNFNEGTAFLALPTIKNCYTATAWKLRPYLIRTDMPSNTYFRGPGVAQGIAIIENIIEHLAKVRNEDSLSLRQRNIGPGPDGDAMRQIIQQVRVSGDYDRRLTKVQEFNEKNRWKKRGLNVCPMIYPIEYPPFFKYNVMVVIYHADGSVGVTHGGTEIGQGVNTKVAQVVARELDIPISMVKILPSNSFTNANGTRTGGSMTSELNCYAAMLACRELKERMRPIKEKSPDEPWPAFVERCYNANIDLTARHYYSPADNVKGYNIHGATLSEIELDVLTGEKQIVRVDLVEDAGQSLSPLVDIGQVEGAFVMGLGLWTSERIVYDPETGRKLTAGTWNYKPPVNRDIPADFRVSLLRNAAHTSGVYRSKATGEPALCMSVGVFFALRNALDSARIQAGHSGWYEMYGPATTDKLQQMALTSVDSFVYHL